MYPTCVIDWYSRYIVGWRLADDVGAAGVCSCVAEAFSGHGAPATLHTDQGSVFGISRFVRSWRSHGSSTAGSHGAALRYAIASTILKRFGCFAKSQTAILLLSESPEGEKGVAVEH